MILETLPPFIDEEVYDDDTFELTMVRFYLTILADDDGKYNVGYATQNEGEDDNMALPSLVTMHSDSLYEAGMRLQAKLRRFQK